MHWGEGSDGCARHADLQRESGGGFPEKPSTCGRPRAYSMEEIAPTIKELSNGCG
ncbi:hypothetical protein JG688_00017988 [Phytophthora aleatoria]|uniref:Uncharacterized protein n=1 Tax=Phytophthora aleatoria TaxID=2496075 RepID=A0A8J5MBE8_9STRA|nr:hypothetical protein JG688_00017988 [Phytophthora aleatoria]